MAITWKELLHQIESIIPNFTQWREFLVWDGERAYGVMGALDSYYTLLFKNWKDNIDDISSQEVVLIITLIENLLIHWDENDKALVEYGFLENINPYHEYYKDIEESLLPKTRWILKRMR
jgi:hypothetical protein